MMEPMGKLAYDLALMRIEDWQREAEHDHLLAELTSERPGRFSQLCVLAGDGLVAFGEWLRQHGRARWQPSENTLSGI